MANLRGRGSGIEGWMVLLSGEACSIDGEWGRVIAEGWRMRCSVSMRLYKSDRMFIDKLMLMRVHRYRASGPKSFCLCSRLLGWHGACRDEGTVEPLNSMRCHCGSAYAALFDHCSHPLLPIVGLARADAMNFGVSAQVDNVDFRCRSKTAKPWAGQR